MTVGTSRDRTLAVILSGTLGALLLVGAYLVIRQASASAPVPPLAEWVSVSGEPTSPEVGFVHGEFVAASVGNPAVRFRYSDRQPRYNAVKEALTSPGA